VGSLALDVGQHVLGAWSMQRINRLSSMLCMCAGTSPTVGSPTLCVGQHMLHLGSQRVVSLASSRLKPMADPILQILMQLHKVGCVCVCVRVCVCVFVWIDVWYPWPVADSSRWWTPSSRSSCSCIRWFVWFLCGFIIWAGNSEQAPYNTGSGRCAAIAVSGTFGSSENSLMAGPILQILVQLHK